MFYVHILDLLAPKWFFLSFSNNFKTPKHRHIYCKFEFNFFISLFNSNSTYFQNCKLFIMLWETRALVNFNPIPHFSAVLNAVISGILSLFKNGLYLSYFTNISTDKSIHNLFHYNWILKCGLLISVSVKRSLFVCWWEEAGQQLADFHLWLIIDSSLSVFICHQQLDIHDTLTVKFQSTTFTIPRLSGWVGRHDIRWIAHNNHDCGIICIRKITLCLILETHRVQQIVTLNFQNSGFLHSQQCPISFVCFFSNGCILKRSHRSN